MMARMPNIRTASSHANSMSAVTTTGHTILPAYRSTLSGMAGLDHFAEMADQAVERLVLRHGDMPGSREIDGEIVDDGRRPPTHDDDTVGQKRGFADAVGHENHCLAIGLPDTKKLDPNFMRGNRHRALTG